MSQAMESLMHWCTIHCNIIFWMRFSGSQKSETTNDQSLFRDLGEDYVSVPVHSQVEQEIPKTPQDFRREKAKEMAEQLTQAALLAGSKNNITVMVLLLPGCGM